MEATGRFSTRVPFLSDLRVPPAVVATPLYNFDEAEWPNEFREVSSIMAGYVMFNSRTQRTQFVDLARPYLRPAMLADFDKRAEIVTLSVPLSKVREPVASPADPVKVIRYSGRIDEFKGTIRSVQVADMVKRMGLPVRNVITTYGVLPPDEATDPYQLELVHSFPDAEWQINLSMDDYYRALSESHVFVCASRTDCFNIVNFESWASGMVGVFWHSKWMDGLLPPDYPFLAHSFEETVAMTRWVVENYAEAREMTAWVRQWVFDNFTQEKMGLEFEAATSRMFSDRLAKNTRQLRRSPAWKLIESTVETELTVEKVIEGMNVKAGTNEVRMMGRGIRQVFTLQGWKCAGGSRYVR
jgi:glycosyltransferase involved in cell wall biosynthesis